jgi:hypothetical protein
MVFTKTAKKSIRFFARRPTELSNFYKSDNRNRSIFVVGVQGDQTSS